MSGLGQACILTLPRKNRRDRRPSENTHHGDAEARRKTKPTTKDTKEHKEFQIGRALKVSALADLEYARFFLYSKKLRCHVSGLASFFRKKEKSMSNTQEQDRVLSRLNARLLGPEEVNVVAGGFYTALCSLKPGSPTFDGDCQF
jgi:hypothetical protein